MNMMNLNKLTAIIIIVLVIWAMINKINELIIISFIVFVIWFFYKLFKLYQRKQTRYIPDDIKEIVIKREYGTCAVCPESDRQLFDFHHKVSYSAGGDNSEKNIQVLCVKHHALVTRNSSYHTD